MTWQNYQLTVLEAWSLRSRWWQDYSFWGLWECIHSLLLVYLLMVSWQALLFSGSWKCHLDLYPYHHLILPLCTSLGPDFPVYIRTSVITDQSPPNDLILLQQSYFQIRSHAKVLAVRISTYESEGDIIQPRMYVIMKFSRQPKRIKLVIRLPIWTYGLLSIFPLSLPCVFISNQFPVNEEQQGFSALEILSPFGAGLLKNCSGLFSLWAVGCPSAVLSAGGLFMTRHSAIWNLKERTRGLHSGRVTQIPDSFCPPHRSLATLHLGTLQEEKYSHFLLAFGAQTRTNFQDHCATPP